MYTTKEIKTRDTIKNLLEAKQAITALFDQAHEIEKQIDHICKDRLNEGYAYSYYFGNRLNSKEQAMKLLESTLWRQFVKMSGLEMTLTKKAVDDLYRNVQDNPPEFCQSEIEAILNNAKQIYGNNIEKTIKEVYSQLIGCRYHGNGWQGKKDNLQGINQTFRIHSYCIQRHWIHDHGFRYESYGVHGFNFEDLYTVCKLLDGKPRSDYSDTFQAHAGEQLKNKSIVETEYFTVKCYKNGNQKVTWNRLDILEMLNKYGSNGQLPDTMKKRYKSEHFSV